MHKLKYRSKGKSVKYFPEKVVIKVKDGVH